VEPPAASQTASASSGEYGTSSFIISLAVSVPVLSLVIQSGVWTRSRSSWDGGRLDEVFGSGDFFAQQELLDHSEFLRGKNVGAKIEIVAGMVNDFERQHGTGANFRVRE